MIHVKKENNLIIIENGQLFSYALDNKSSWELGRPSKDNVPDIKLHSTTISRKHGKFQNMDGIWFYLDYKGKNGTVYNHRHLEAGLNGRIRPVMLDDGDTFVFGGGEEEIINCKTIWGMFVTKSFDDGWRVVDSKGYQKLKFISGEDSITMDSPKKGFVFEKETGIAIYMDDLTYLTGDVEVIGL
ncbi:FHA domain-containing protein [Oribacterium sp. FC2011]|uniref:FHA domain-containing protein n=1 Tax=Oribacterium sp. FC2011 TaxID=1408311 RepID=UPI0004E16EE7|nr:FHA domain-containing protein [Oribacterium sp. FC2011]